MHWWCLDLHHRWDTKYYRHEKTHVQSLKCNIIIILLSYTCMQISFASSSTRLNDRRRFKTLFRTLPCHVYVPSMIATLMNKFKWKQMAVITQDESPFTTVCIYAIYYVYCVKEATNLLCQIHQYKPDNSIKVVWKTEVIAITG